MLQAFGASQAGNYASALAFNTLLAMFPLMLGILAIIGLSVRHPATEARFQLLIVATFPSTAQPRDSFLRARTDLPQRGRGDGPHPRVPVPQRGGQGGHDPPGEGRVGDRRGRVGSPA